MPENGRCDGKPGCKGKGIVGLGRNPRWLCLACFDAAMKRAGDEARAMAKALSPSPAAETEETNP